MDSINHPHGRSLLRRLELAATNHPTDTAIRFLPTGDIQPVESRSYGQLRAGALAVGGALRAQAEAGDRGILLLSPGPDYFAAVWGCLLSGVQVVPLPVPAQPGLIQLVSNVVKDCAPAICLLEASAPTEWKQLIEQAAPGCHLLTLDQALQAEPAPTWPADDPQRPALLQYTSGSTGVPKGAVVTHGNIAASIELMLNIADIDPASVVVSWLPIFHNMGFLSFGLLPLATGASLVLLPTSQFMLNPARWFLAISHFRGTHSGGPNIGYETCLNFLPDPLRGTRDFPS